MKLVRQGGMAAGRGDRGQVLMQRRLIRLITCLLLVLVLMRHAAEPRNWNWFWTLAPSAPNASGPLAATAAAPPSGVEPVTAPGLAGLDVSLLNSIRDDSHFRADEQEAWFHLWEKLQAMPRSEEALTAASLGPISYLQLYRQTPVYRGQLVDLEGIIRRAHRLSAPANSLGISHYWQCWFFQDDSPTSPMVVYLLEPPGGLTDDRMEMELPARVTACVFKRWAYSRGEQILVAPVVLATHVRPGAELAVDEALGVSRSSRERSPSWGLILGLALGAILLAWVLARSPQWLASARATHPDRSQLDFSQIQRPVSREEDELHETSR